MNTLNYEEYAYMLNGAYEMHVHTAPSHLDRKMDDWQFAYELDKYKMAGGLIKTHYGATTARTKLVNAHSGCDARLFGSVTLDWPVGGLNPYAVESELLLGASVVWMPTFHAQNQIETTGPFKLVKGPGMRVTDENGKLRKEVNDIIDLVKSFNAVLATGHISAEESRVLCLEARKKGCDIILTHPDSNNEHVPIEIQKEVADAGAFVEKCWLNLYKDEDTAEDMADKIRTISVEQCIMSTDLGNRVDDTSPVGLMKFIDTLLRQGISPEQIEIMLKTNPKYLLRV